MKKKLDFIEQHNYQEEGEIAQRAGAVLEDCPYDHGTEEFWNWRLGWIESKKVQDIIAEVDEEVADSKKDTKLGWLIVIVAFIGLVYLLRGY